MLFRSVTPDPIDGYCASWSESLQDWIWEPCEDSDSPDPYDCVGYSDCRYWATVCLGGQNVTVPIYFDVETASDQMIDENAWHVARPCPPSGACSIVAGSGYQSGLSVVFLGSGQCPDARLRSMKGGGVVLFYGVVTQIGFDEKSGKYKYRAYLGGGPADGLKCKAYIPGVGNITAKNIFDLKGLEGGYDPCIYNE